MKKFEYAVVTTDNQNVILSSNKNDEFIPKNNLIFNDVGLLGWEMCGVVDYGCLVSLMYYFKREIL